MRGDIERINNVRVMWKICRLGCSRNYTQRAALRMRSPVGFFLFSVRRRAFFIFFCREYTRRARARSLVNVKDRAGLRFFLRGARARAEGEDKPVIRSWKRPTSSYGSRTVPCARKYGNGAAEAGYRHWHYAVYTRARRGEPFMRNFAARAK